MTHYFSAFFQGPQREIDYTLTAWLREETSYAVYYETAKPLILFYPNGKLELYQHLLGNRFDYYKYL